MCRSWVLVGVLLSVWSALVARADEPLPALPPHTVTPFYPDSRALLPEPPLSVAEATRATVTDLKRFKNGVEKYESKDSLAVPTRGLRVAEGSRAYALPDLKKVIDAVLKDYRERGELDVSWKVTRRGPTIRWEREVLSDEEKVARINALYGLLNFGGEVLSQQVQHSAATAPGTEKPYFRNPGGPEEQKMLRQARIVPIPLAPPSAEAYRRAMPESLKRLLFDLQVRHQLLFEKGEVY